MSSGTEQESLADGVVEEVIADLSLVRHVRLSGSTLNPTPRPSTLSPRAVTDTVVSKEPNA